MAERKKKVKQSSSSNSLYFSFPPIYQLIGAIIISIITAVFLTHFIAKSPINAVRFTLPDPPSIQSNNHLSSSHLLLEDSVYGPESIAEDPKTGRLYAGLKTGLICEINMDKHTNKAHIVRAVRLTNATDCDGSYSSFPKCGRPLGIRFSPTGTLLVVDAYLGLFEVDLKNEKVYTLVRAGSSIDNVVETPPLRYLNDVDVLPDGRIVMSESSYRFDDRDMIYDMFEHRPNGRLLIFDRSTESLKEVASDLYFPNGIVVYRGKVIIAEMGTARILSFSPSSGSVRVLIDNLPGYPDNLRRSFDGRTIWIAIPVMRSKGDNWFNERPHIRELLAKLFSRQALELITSYFSPSYGCVLRMDVERAEIVDSLQDATGSTVSSISCATETIDGHLVMGSDDNYYIARVPV